MAISSINTSGPSIPVGAKTIAFRNIQVANVTPKEDVTVLGDTARVYASPPLVNTGSATVTQTCSVSGNLKSNTMLATTASTTNTGWICESYEKTYEVGKYATFSCEFSYYPPAT